MSNTTTRDYIVANGPEGLSQVLSELLDKSKSNPEFAEQETFVLYQLGDQKSLIKVDMQTTPFQFWYYDLLGRPATKLVKEVLINFLWEKCGGKEIYLQEVSEGEIKE